MKFREKIENLIDKAYDFAEKVSSEVRAMAKNRPYKLVDKKVAKLNARLKRVAPLMSANDILELEAEMQDIDGVELTKSGRISVKGLNADAISALEEMIPTKKQYETFVHDRQMRGFAIIGRINGINSKFEHIMNMYYSNWEGKTRIRNSDLSRLPKDLQGQLARMMSKIGSEYARGGDIDFSNISEEEWDRLENYLDQYQKML